MVCRSSDGAAHLRPHLGALVFALFCTCAAAQSVRITPSGLQSLSAQGDLQWVRTSATAQEQVAVAKVGAIVWTREPDYLIVVGDASMINALRTMGLLLEKPSQEHFKIRPFRVPISTKSDYQRLRTLISDVFPANQFPTTVRGRAYDAELAWAREAGFAVELCHTPDCT